MSRKNFLAAFLIGFVSHSLAALAATSGHAARSQCINSQSDRQCWDGTHDIGTDVDEKWPVTGNTVTYHIEIANTTCDPDGSGNAKPCMLMNGQYPGPAIRANWGDTVVVNVQNSMQNNGTSLHWHGVRHYMANDMDGTPGLTECPLAPGSSKTYSFTATQHGSSWYHSHYSPQYGDGIVGPIIFDGPTTANYDVDLGAYPISDWAYQSSWQIEYLAEVAFQSGGKDNAVMNNILVNGTNKSPSGTGQYSTTTIQPGKRYLLRLMSMTVDNFVQVSLDGHQFEVVAADFTPITPITVDWLLLGSGQRYDVIITANQTAGNFWFRAEPATACGSSNDFYGRAVWSYSNAKAGTPTTSPLSPIPATCEEPAPLVPYWHRPTSQDSFSQNIGTLEIDSTFNTPPVDDFDNLNNSKILLWTLDPSTGATMNVNWSNPTLSYVINDNTNYPKDLQLLPAVSAGGTNYWVIQQPANSAAVAHPMHLHGHDFAVLGQGTGKFDPASSTLNFDTPTRRDTVSVYAGPEGTWTVIAFLSNNPGAWILHCHIAWHVSGGLGVQFLESPGKITLSDPEQYQDQCSKYSSYSAAAVYQKDDSGI